MKNFVIISLSLAVLAAVAHAEDPANKKQPGAAARKTADTTRQKSPDTMEAMQPPTELTDMEKKMDGTWKCSGTAMGMGGAERSMNIDGSMSFKADLDQWWMQSSLDVASKDSKDKGHYKAASYTTYDPVAKKWYRTTMNNMGGSEQLSSTGWTNNKMTWEGETRAPHAKMARARSRHIEERISDNEVRATGEMSMDGKGWTKSYDVDCKK
jgi:hypothetical protein